MARSSKCTRLKSSVLCSWHNFALRELTQGSSFNAKKGSKCFMDLIEQRVI